MKKANKNALDSMVLEIKKKDDEIKILKNNMKKTNFGFGGRIYIVKPPGEIRELYKLGKTEDLDKRLPTYNTTLPDNIDVVYEIELKNVKQVEKCIKGILQKYLYRSSKKEYFECSLKIIKNAIDLCNDAINSDPECKTCKSKILSRTVFN